MSARRLPLPPFDLQSRLFHLRRRVQELGNLLASYPENDNLAERFDTALNKLHQAEAEEAKLGVR